MPRNFIRRGFNDHARLRCNRTKLDLHDRWAGQDLETPSMPSATRSLERVSNATTSNTLDWLIGAGGILGAAPVFGGFYEFPGTRSMNSIEPSILAVHVTRNVAASMCADHCRKNTPKCKENRNCRKAPSQPYWPYGGHLPPDCYNCSPLIRYLPHPFLWFGG